MAGSPEPPQLSAGIDGDGGDGVDDDVVRRYPYPLAATYSRAYFQAADLGEMHEYLMDLFEATLKFCAAIVMSQYFHDKLRDPRISRELLELERPSLGHWQGWLRDILALYRRENRALAVPELAVFYRQKHTGAILQAAQGLQRVIGAMGDTPPDVSSGGITSQQFFDLLGQYRNRLAHGARPNPRDREHVAELLQPALRQLYKEMPFFAEYRLVHVREVTLEFDSQQRQRYRYVVTRLTGEMLRIATVPSLVDTAFPSKLIYLLDPRAAFAPLLSLHPIVVLGYCESCNREQTFLLNMSDADRQDYVAYQCTHHFSPSEYSDYMRQLLSDLQVAAGIPATGSDSAATTSLPAAPAQPESSWTVPGTLPAPLPSAPPAPAAPAAPMTPAPAPQYPMTPGARAPVDHGRLSGKVIMALIAAVVVVLGGTGVAVAAIIGSKPAPPDTASGTGGQPTPTLTPGPSPSLTPTPTPQGSLHEAAFASVYVPTGFTDLGPGSSSVCQYDYVNAPTFPEQIVYDACSLPPTVVTNRDFDNLLLSDTINRVDPNAAPCPNFPVATIQINGDAGQLTADQICINNTVMPQNGQAYAGTAIICAAVVRQPGGALVGVYIAFLARSDQMAAFERALPQREIFTQTVFKHATAS